MSTIDIGIATFRRPDLLADLMQSLSKLELADGWTVTVIVADNDPEVSAAQCVAGFKSTFGYPINFITVKDRGISYARNAILNASSADYLAFLDDDECVSPDWLQSMLECLHNYRADVVFGPVLGILPQGAPRWAREHPSFCRPRKTTGTLVTNGATNNVLFNFRRVREIGLSFDPAFALTGGGDTDFFHRASVAGLRMVWCDNAVATEAVPPERLRLDWVLRRGFRGGQCYSRIFLRNQSAATRLLGVLSKSGQCLLVIPILPLVAFFSSSTSVQLATRAAGWMGQIAVFVRPGHWYKEYESADYRKEMG